MASHPVRSIDPVSPNHPVYPAALILLCTIYSSYLSYLSYLSYFSSILLPILPINPIRITNYQSVPQSSSVASSSRRTRWSLIPESPARSQLERSVLGWRESRRHDPGEAP